AQVRTAGGAGMPSVVKEWQIWQQQPGNEGKSLEDFMRLKQGLQQRTPANLQEYEVAKKQYPDLTFEEFITNKARWTATGRATGEAETKARQGLPAAINQLEEVERTVNLLKNDPNLGSTVGPIRGKLPNITDEAKAIEGRVKHLGGQLYISAYETLRGAG